MEDQAPPEQLPVVVHTTGTVVRGRALLGRIRRLSDLMNQTSLAFLGVIDAEVSAPGSDVWAPAGRHVSVNKDEILFVYPQGGAGTSRLSGLQVEKFPVTVGLYIGDYRLQGAFYLLDRVPWEDLLSGLRDRFMPLTDVTVSLVGAAAAPVTADFVSVNRERVSLLYEC
jgi:hypothetical protein